MRSLFSPKHAVVLALFVQLGTALLPARPITTEDLFKFHRVSDPQLSPDGQWVAYVVTDVLYEQNRTNSDLWLVPAAGGEPRQLTRSPRGDSHPRWSPDGKWLAFESSRSGETQIWLLPMSAAGGEARQLTTLSTGAGQPVWSPTGDRLAFVSAVYPEFSGKPFAEADKLNREKDAARENSKVKAHIMTQLLYRHWDSWVGDKRQQLFVVGVKDGAADGEPRNVTPGENDGVPTSGTFSAGDDFCFSPDGKSLVFAAPPLPVRTQAWSTNHDLWSVDLTTGAWRQLTTNPAADAYPRFSPDGKWLAYRAQSRPGFEADKWELRVMAVATGESRSVTAGVDISADAFVWSRDSRQLLFTADEKGLVPVWSVEVDGGTVNKLVATGANADLSVSGGQLVFTQSRLAQPPEVMTCSLGQSGASALTHTNDALLAELELPVPESVTVAGDGGTPVQMWILKPPGFDPAKKYPLVFWVHGGPQGAFSDSWSTRWNAEAWAAQGYVLAMPNPRGSTGFGQRFTDEISRDWGGRVYGDLMACLGYLEKQGYVDSARMAAAGASYGGYMMNWFQGHTDKFKTLITHCGVYEFSGMYGATEEVWFDEWEHGIPWESPEFGRWSPHQFAANFKTPNLIIHNELDFRVPFGQGQSLFTTLQRKGIPSKFLVFPDEGHWVLKPQNSALWHQTIFDWLAVYLK